MLGPGPVPAQLGILNEEGQTPGRNPSHPREAGGTADGAVTAPLLQLPFPLNPQAKGRDRCGLVSCERRGHETRARTERLRGAGIGVDTPGHLAGVLRTAQDSSTEDNWSV